MNQTAATKGKFAAFLNRDKQPGDSRPMFTDGKISKPDMADELPVTLWAFEYTDKKSGEVLTGFSGKIGAISASASPDDHIQALMKAPATEAPTLEALGNLKVGPHSIVLFVSKPKEGGKDNQKTHYGYVNFGDGTPLVDLSVWLSKDRYGRPILTGNTQYPQPAKSHCAVWRNANVAVWWFVNFSIRRPFHIPVRGLSTSQYGGLSTSQYGGLSTSSGGGMSTSSSDVYRSNIPPWPVFVRELEVRGYDQASAIIRRCLPKHLWPENFFRT
jgi:hypothetical protein